MRLWFMLVASFVSLWAQPKTSLLQNPSRFLENNQTASIFQEYNQYEMLRALSRTYPLLDPCLDLDYCVKDINANNEMSGEYKLLVEDTVYLQVILISAVGVLVLLPESISKWDISELQESSLSERWVKNVTTKPVWDEDEWAINYIGHPVSGAVYYTMARNDGLSIFESAAFSTIMSTFFWEYGYESFAETPSIQDLIVTPLIGSFMGEGMHQLELILDENKGVIWGSKGLGSFSYFLLDPLGNIAGGMSDFFDVSVSMHFKNYTHYQDPSQFRFDNDQNQEPRFEGRDYGFVLVFE